MAKEYLLSLDSIRVENLREAGTCLVSFQYATDGKFVNEMKATGVTCQELTYDATDKKWIDTYLRIAQHCDTLIFVGDSFTSAAIIREREKVVRKFSSKAIVMTNGWRDGEIDINKVEFKALSWDKFYLNFIGRGAITAAQYFRNHPRLKTPMNAAASAKEKTCDDIACCIIS
mmetsp:Transcript_1167/g.1378  ORF Transcript_1167/g.1378 Transcript_1167/m.1378 type:complete len:173 (+) Transcript_1167:188-706(+)|eukprot:CAMPEP_0184019824 /NCGR_PEP_ID=MMETSP0954-20121128/8980_1 /TAXON_ID=627963 /ORGANISM="Aplanochytrium sp, Strain PBS07" /LENGTH=172 /DNA_ID=CAMNT_0026301561 /DNA_START=104 /DNA_END=622 /DNA_ORIENTATION=+